MHSILTAASNQFSKSSDRRLTPQPFEENGRAFTMQHCVTVSADKGDVLKVGT